MSIDPKGQSYLRLTLSAYLFLVEHYKTICFILWPIYLSTIDIYAETAVEQSIKSVQ